ncbi:pyrroline-5-carboxylate reductase 3 isoform X2 [Sceloporus undulatus]|uniref:pyrroline-5-carboxylate reductase 3 isoform X2 n=1 Tax=Sceloporus undulatus TaxID=8520 RepID=UPI001C4D90CC|nr:pyrroline-5-carboxylate reductase 3 isoform X2 [Sceloporus undulatus]
MEKLRELRVGFIGAGRMASAVAQAMLLAGRIRTTLSRSPEAPFQQDNFEGCHGRSPRKLLRSQVEQPETHSSGAVTDVEHPGWRLRMFPSQDQVENQVKTHRDKTSHLRSPGVGLPSHARSPVPYPKTQYWRPEGDVQAVNIFASAPSNRNLDKFQTLSCKTTHSNLEVLQNCTFIFLATKPHILPAVLKEIAPAVNSKHVVISMAAGVTLQTLEEHLPAGTKVLRIMPNLPCMVQSGAIILARGSCVGENEVDLLKMLLSPSGLCEEAPESYIDIHAGLSGSGVAYVYMFAEALAEGAVKMGMPGPMANRIAAQTLLGAAKMILETGEHPAVLRSAVCTPGGTTIHALHELEKGSLRATVMNAVEAATSRARELGKR